MPTRREFLLGLKKWSKAVVGGIVAGAVLKPSDAEAGWVNRRGGGGGGWANARGGGGGWVNRRGGGGWLNAR